MGSLESLCSGNEVPCGLNDKSKQKFTIKEKDKIHFLKKLYLVTSSKVILHSSCILFCSSSFFFV